MAAAEYNFKLQKSGDTFNGLKLTCTRTSEGITTPINLENALLKMQIRKEKACPVIFELSSEVGGGITIENAASGIFKIDTFTVPEVSSFKYIYDIEFNFPNGVVKTYINGYFPIESDVTR